MPRTPSPSAAISAWHERGREGERASEGGGGRERERGGDEKVPVSDKDVRHGVYLAMHVNTQALFFSYLQLAVLVDAFRGGALDVEDLAAQRQDGLGAAVAALLGAAGGGVSLHDVNLALCWVA